MALRTLRYTSLASRKLGARLAHHKSSISSVAVIGQSHDRIGVEVFRHQAFEPETPLCMKAVEGGLGSKSLPAIRKWFQPLEGDVMRPLQTTAASYLEDFGMTLLPYELLYPQRNSPDGEVVRQFIQDLTSSDSNQVSPLLRALGDHLSNQLPTSTNSDAQKLEQEQKLLRFQAPLALLLAALAFNHRVSSNSPSDTRGFPQPQQPLRNLYIAQAPINDLPEELYNDLPATDIVKKCGKGDVYGSSIWLGLEPTYTPLHRDPNPNLFVQLCSTKVVRLLPPSSGDRIFHQVQQRLGRSSGNSRIRGMEMMQGLEREAFYKAVWEPEKDESGSDLENNRLDLPMQEAVLAPGDALYIPKGWWHSVKSKFSDGRLNGAANWWFR